MSIFGIGTPAPFGPIGAFGGRLQIESRRVAPVAKPLPSLAPLERLQDQLRQLRVSLDRLNELSGGLRVVTRRTGGSAVAGVATSASALDLEPYATFTSLDSTEEVNTVPTSFSPRGPAFTGLTTSLPTIGGVYDGDQGDDVLTFTARQNAAVGSGQKLRFRVTDGAGNFVENLKFDAVAIDEPVTLKNGLTFSLGAGAVFKDDTFTVAVSTSVPSSVDPTKPFDGTRNDDPNFDPGLSVVAGSFEVNGESIAVAADDSIDAVVARITASNAGVTASFDAATERVLLVQKTAGSVPDIVLGADTSGFLAATKLAAATAVPGQDGVDPVHEVIASVPALDGISTGDFSINGLSIAVDIDTDSLGDVLDRINASAAGVRATLDPATRKVTVTPDDPAAALNLDDGSSGLFSALLITPGSYDPSAATQSSRKEVRIEDSEKLRPLLGQVGRFLGQVFRDAGTASAPTELGAARDALRSALVTAVLGAESEAPGSPHRTGFGIDFDFDDANGKVLQLGARRFARELGRDAGGIDALLFAEAGKDGVGGIVPALLEAVEAVQGSVAASVALVDARGNLFDRLV